MPQFYSHAIEENGVRKGTKFLKEHLKEVGESIKEKIPPVSGYNRHLLSSIGYLVGISHDFGKYTTFFQNHLLSCKKESGGKHWHGFISALFAAYLVNEFAKDKEDISQFFTLISFFVVLHHHGDLGAIENYVIPERELKGEDFLLIEEPLRSKLKNLEHQLQDINTHLTVVERDYNELLSNVGLLSEEIKIAPFLTSWRSIFSLICKLSYQLLEEKNEPQRRKLFALLLIFYSTLIDVDKRNAAEVVEIERRKELPENLVDSYRELSPEIDTLATERINGIRNEIYGSVTGKILDISLGKHILTLIAPTGTGKTLTSFSVALKLRRRLAVNNCLPRIIYSLPFTSIIDQNYAEIRKVLLQLPDFIQNEGAYLIKHHHLADLKYKVENEEKPVDESLLLIESWDSEVIVTTFIQFLHTVIGFKNRFLKKYHNIAGSIIILDEVQNIPIEYWPLVNKMLKLLTEELGCYIILLTATRPLIFEEKETIPLLENCERYFRQMDRVRLIPDMQELTLEGLFSKFNNIYNKRNSYLIVLNTIKSSIRFYELLKEDNIFALLIKEGRGFYLSTNIIPKERGARIEEIKRRLDRKEKIVIVSTQVIEAGINMDVDVVIRDIGPFDSIVQVAGRCNREMEKNQGEVYVFNLFHLTDGCNGYAQYVYGKVHPAVTLKLFNGEIIEESRFFDLINHYFEILKEKKNQDISEEIWKAVREFRFHRQNENPSCISDFELIKEKSGYVDVFIEADDESIKIWEDYVVKVIVEKDFRKRQNNYFSMRKDYNSYIVSIPRKLSRGLEQINDTFYHLPYSQREICYEDDTGFKRTEESDFIF